MTITLRVFIAIVVLVPASAATGRADDAAKIHALVAAFKTAYAHEDIAGLTRCIAPNFTDTDDKRTAQRAEVLTVWKRSFNLMDRVQNYDLKVDSLQIIKDQAVAVTRSRLTVLIKPLKRKAPGAAGKPHTLVVSSEVRTFLIKTAGHWLIRSRTHLRSSRTLDGKPLTATMR